ncbi:hypothetical protein MYX64_06050 [Nitrospinae bacterium AH_259_B05_G02_I21]|nr:hypothetical protein [Nitrospinae bacterium AH_259_B05_G02_I21]MDA2931786.1 hypothetical protein [Nitrospinae bacterium AH-259-F20]
MKPPTYEILTGGPLQSMGGGGELGMLDVLEDLGLTKDEACSKVYNIPTVFCTVNDHAMHYKDNDGIQGDFIVKAISEIVACPVCGVEEDSEGEERLKPTSVLIGYITRPKFFGLIKKELGATSCPDCGGFTIYPKEIIETILSFAEIRVLKRTAPVESLIASLKKSAE